MDLNLYLDVNNIENNIITNPIHQFIQEIELAIKTSSSELWGFRYSIDINEYAFNQYITLERISKEISEFISSFCENSNQFPYEVNVDVVEIDGEKMLYIKVTVSNTDSVPPETYTSKFIFGL